MGRSPRRPKHSCGGGDGRGHRGCSYIPGAPRAGQMIPIRRLEAVKTARLAKADPPARRSRTELQITRTTRRTVEPRS